MSHFIHKLVPHFIHSNFNRLLVLQLSSLQPLNANNDFTVKYFVDKCGFSRENAVSASKDVNFGKPDKPDACLSFLKNHGFTDTQLFKMLTKYPRIVVSDPENILLPKIQFLHSLGFPETDITALFVSEPRILVASLEGCIIPICDLLEDHLCSVQNAMIAIKSCPRILSVSHTHVIEHNIELLKEARVSTSRIVYSLRTQPLVFACSSDKMREVVKDITKMRFDPRSLEFMSAVCVMGSLSKLAWKNKLKVYQRWGCAEEEVLKAFKRVPNCMKISEEKIDGVMGVLVNEMGCKPQIVLLTPHLFEFSLQKRIVPRCSVVKLLLSKGLLKVKPNLYTVVKYPENIFLEKFINFYKKKTPELLKLYEEKMKNSEDEFL